MGHECLEQETLFVVKTLENQYLIHAWHKAERYKCSKNGISTLRVFNK